MAIRKVLRVQGEDISVASESRFESEERLRSAVAAHPEVLPSEDIGLGPLVTLAIEVDFGAGPIDLLAVDPTGRLVVAEFKRGTENPDVRKVVAQVLDYGSSLWRKSSDQLEAACARCRPGLIGSITDHVERGLEFLGEGTFDPDAFRSGVDACLDNGSFVFLYVGRDLDDRTRRIMTYLAEGPRMSFFAVEVDYFRGGDDDDTSVLVPRTAFVPSWVKEPSPRSPGTVVSSAARLATAPEGTAELMERMDELAAELGLDVVQVRTGRRYCPRGGQYGVGVYTSTRGAEFNLDAIRSSGREDLADSFRQLLSELAGRPVTGRGWPAVSAQSLLSNWQASKARVLLPLFGALASVTPAGSREA